MRRLADDKILVEAFCNSTSIVEKHQLFEKLIGRYTQKIHNLALRITRCADTTEEVMQEVFITVFTKLHTFRGDSAFSSWLYRITTNTSFLQLRSRKRYFIEEPSRLKANDNSPNILPVNISNGQETYLQEIRDALEQALAELPDDHRAIFILRDMDGLSNAEIGEALKMTVPAVKSRLHRSRLSLRKKLQRHYDDYMKPGEIMYGKEYFQSEYYQMAA